MTREEFDNQQLPKSGSNSYLETLSRNKLKVLFNPEQFEVRDELQADKGIDLTLEIKSNGKNTNLRFPLQLKSTGALEKNMDESISYSIAVANINYLLNDGLPAFYILYYQPEDIFYYEKVQDVEDRLKRKYPDGIYPDSFTVRFDKKLNQSVIDTIRVEMLSRGFLRRNINQALSLTGDDEKLKDSVYIAKNHRVHRPSENKRFLEKHGFIMLNSGKFSDILNIEKDCYPLEGDSTVFYFICGAAYYYKGNYLNALNHFKSAGMNLDALHPQSRNMMTYFKTQAKRYLGMINREESEGYIEALTDSEYLGLYLKLQKAFDAYYVSDEDDITRVDTFKRVVDGVLTSPHCSNSIELIAESYILSIEGHQLNQQLLDYLLRYRDSFGRPYNNPKNYELRTEQIESYNKHLRELKERAIKDKNQFTYNNICLNGIKIFYIKTFYTDIILGMDRGNFTITSTLDEQEKRTLREIADQAGAIAEVCAQIGVADNMIAALSQQYELLHFIGDIDAANLVLKRMEQQILDNEWHGLEHKLKFLKDAGTSHERFTEMIISSLMKNDERKRELELLRVEIETLNNEDRQFLKKITGKKNFMQVFPLGQFVFSELKLDAILTALNVEADARISISKVMKIGAVPIVNAFRNPIRAEGPDGGFSADKGADSIIRLNHIRNELRKNEAYLV